MKLELITIPEMSGSLDGLRAVSDRIVGDFIVIMSDAITDITLGKLVHQHRVRTSDLTMTLSSIRLEQEIDRKTSTSSKKSIIQDEDQEFIGLTPDCRVVVKTPGLELDESFDLSKPLLQASSNMFLRNDVIDVGIYVMSHWILELIKANKSLSSIRMDLVPFLVKRQFQSLEYLSTNVPGIIERKRPMHALESWLVTSDSKELLPHVTSPLDLLQVLCPLPKDEKKGNFSSILKKLLPFSSHNICVYAQWYLLYTQRPNTPPTSSGATPY